MKIEEYRVYTDACFRNTPPPCSSRCPFGLDVRKLVDKARSGKLKSPFRMYREAVLFPQVVSQICDAPCKEACVRCKNGTAVDLSLIEKGCTELGYVSPSRYTLPKKTQKIAVVGAGPSGLACALRMASRGYQMTVFEKEDTIGGSALSKMDREACIKGFMTEFSVFDVDFHLHQEVENPELLLTEYDAVYIATGRDGSDFDLLSGYRPSMMASRISGIFLGGEVTGEKGFSDAMADGMNAADSIEVFFKLGDKEVELKRLGQQEPDARYYKLYTSEEVGEKPACSASLDIKERTIQEAHACHLCNCSACIDVCPLMQTDGRDPKKICADVITTVKPSMTKRTAVRLIAGCTDCGRCKEACPENIDMGNVLMEARKDLHEDGAFAPALHDFWMQDLEFNRSSEAALIYTPSKDTKSNLVFFPGCQLSAASPETVKKAYAWLLEREEDASLYLGCCGLPALWAGRHDLLQEVREELLENWRKLGEPTFVLACTACQAHFKKYCEEIPTLSLYQYLNAHKDTLAADKNSEDQLASVFDPCGALEDEETVTAVRSLLQHLGFMPTNEKSFGCCGYGGHIMPATEEIFDTFAKKRLDSLEEGSEAIVYCANCRNIYAAKGMKTNHLLDIVFDNKTSDFTPPSLDTLRANRRRLKAYYTGDTYMEPASDLTIHIPSEVQKKMDRCLILGEQIQSVIEKAEQTCQKMYDKEQDLYYACERFRYVTIWAVYRITDGEYHLKDVYSHRVDVRQ